MLQNNKERFDNLSSLIKDLWKENNKNKSLEISLHIANEVIRILGIPESDLEEPEAILNKAFSNAKFKNQKMESWFEKHPFFGSGRIALQHYDKGKYPVETKFYQLNESFSKARVSATTQIEPNWEDNELTMLPDYKVGLDFFLDSKAKSLSLVLTNRGNLRVMELSERLTNTQIDIFKRLNNVFILEGIEGNDTEEQKYEPQRTIHQALWKAFELKEVNKKFYIGIANLFTQLSTHLEEQKDLIKKNSNLSKQSKQFANRLIGRILFLWFLNKKELISNNFSYFLIERDSTSYYNEKLKVLFYDVLNTPIEERTKTEDKDTPYLNGGLFEMQPNDLDQLNVNFPNNWFKEFYEHLNEFNFTTDESSPEYEQIAIDPEMLGRVFENLLASIVPETSNAANEKKNKGAFYTPREIVSFMCKESLKEHIKNSLENKKDFDGVEKLIDMSDSDYIDSKSTGKSLIWGNRSEEVRLQIIESLNSIKILDPACGSGAFPIGFMQLMIKILERLSTVYDTKTNKHRPAKASEKFDIHLAKLSVLRNSLYGSDIEPMAIEISKLRAWLSLVIDVQTNIDPLPNLEFNFVCANSLIYLPEEYQQTIFDDNSHEEILINLRNKYFQTHGLKRKKLLRDEFNKNYAELSNNESLGIRNNLLKTWNPFKYDKPAEFYDSKVMQNVDKFDVVIGNPPYVNLGNDKSNNFSIYNTSNYTTFDGRGDLYVLFFERSIKMLAKNGIISFITSNKWFQTKYGQKLINFLIKESNPKLILNLGEGVFESAQVDTSILLSKKEQFKNELVGCNFKPNSNSTLKKSSIFPQLVKIYLLLNKPLIIASIMDNNLINKINSLEDNINSWPNINIRRGLMTGLNDAFVISESTFKSIESNCNLNEKELLKSFIKPVIGGKEIKSSKIYWKKNYIILAYFESNIFIQKNIKPLFDYLSKFEKQLKNRAQCTYTSRGEEHSTNKDYPGMHHWLELDNRPSLDNLSDFKKTKIIWPDISAEPEFILENDELYLLDTLYFITSKDIELLYKIISSDLYKFYIKFITPTLGNESRRYKAEFIKKIPLPNYNQCKEINFEIEKFVGLNKEEIAYLRSINKI
jgi:hypothetical protein